MVLAGLTSVGQGFGGPP